MQSQPSFEVIVRRRVPYLTSLLFHILMACVTTLVVIDFLFLPVSNAPLELQVVYYIFIIPDIVKDALLISSIGFVTVLPFYLIARLHKKAKLTFFPDRLFVASRTLRVELPIGSFRKVYCMDSHDLDGRPKEKLIICFEQKNFRITRIRLKDYSEADDFMERLLQYKGVDFKIYDFHFAPSLEEEE